MVVSTTEHTHAFATLPALRLDKHVYCEKPLAHAVYNARVVAEEAKQRPRLATQMGTQIHAGDNYRRVVELVQSGAIGAVCLPLRVALKPCTIRRTSEGEVRCED